MTAFRNERGEVDERMEEMYEMIKEIRIVVKGDFTDRDDTGLVGDVKMLVVEVKKNTEFRHSIARDFRGLVLLVIGTIITSIVAGLTKIKGIW